MDAQRRTLTSQRKNKVFVQCGRQTQHPVLVCSLKKRKKTCHLHVLNIHSTHVPMHEHTHTQTTQPFSWYGLPLSMQMTFIMQMHTNQNQPSENRSWEKPQRIKLNEGGGSGGVLFLGGGVTKVRRSVVVKVEKVQCGQPKIDNISCFIRPQIPKAG